MVSPTLSKPRSQRYNNGGPLNIQLVWDAATPQEIEEGRNWYATASNRIQLLAQQYEYPTEVVAGVVAALSPCCRWERNILDAEKVLQATMRGEDVRGCSTYRFQIDKAVAIARGAPIIPTLGPNARKTQAFYRLLVEPNADIVVVDSHAYAIWEGRYRSISQIAPLWQALYNHIERDYRAAARELGEKVSNVQAVTWVAWHRIWAEEMA